MTGFLDTSVIVRYLTGDPPDLARRAMRIVEGEERLLLSEAVIAETAHVLRSIYGVPREAVVDHLIAFIQRRNVSVVALDKGFVIQGLLLCRPSGRTSVVDALVWAGARSSGHDVVYSFDDRFPSDGIDLRR